ncbi:DUF6434 domain-containing protein [Priestia taiwanensis]|uniref:DUF6434 domain-containing protein n=1 Tax=Priestia taiwanensis TaxID=1347902 RepID=A0A917AIX4_9BACI|nr:DUF6434 domain-containing protein [Priestia taiwanensis]MBM7361625.1 hypothetical protein [Priestia taiwanensis]GGE55618.1 hypothetical protein GCM10007140_02480 [Priestia taiwanensis]
MRPALTKEIHIEDFRAYYWLKEELQSFCRQHGMSASGSKGDITERIDVFLRTGEIQKPVRKRVSKPTENVVLTLHTVITEHHRCSQHVRAFFKEVIGPKFHFSTYIQTYFKQNVGKTYQDVVNAWHEEEKRKKDPMYKKEISSQFEYNQFTRDFFADPANNGKSRQDAIDAWKEVKNKRGSRRYG